MGVRVNMGDNRDRLCCITRLIATHVHHAMNLCWLQT